MNKYLFHSAFLSAISLLIFANFNLLKIEKDHRFALAQVVSVNELARPVFFHERKWLIFEVKKAVDAYRHPINEKYRNRAIETGNQLRQFEDFIGQNLENGTESVEKLTFFKDTLLKMVEEEKDLKEQLGPVLQHQKVDLASFYAELSDPETAFLNELAMLESRLHTNISLYYHMKKIGVFGGCGFDSFEPVFMPICLNPRVGQMAEVQVVLSAYVPGSDRNLKIFLNDQPLTVEFGKAHFTQEFTQPGLQKIKIRAERQIFEIDGNEIEPKTKVVEKEFYVNVPELH